MECQQDGNSLPPIGIGIPIANKVEAEFIVHNHANHAGRAA